MSTTTTIAQGKPGGQGKSQGQRKNKRGGAKRGGGPGHQGQGQSIQKPAQVQEEPKTPEDVDEEDGEELCWICAEPIKYYSVPACNHRTCHVCALRLRALYKKMECTFCKEPQPTVIFTTSPDASYIDLSKETEKEEWKDERLKIVFSSKEMMEDTLVLLRFNCPAAFSATSATTATESEPACTFVAKGWADLKLHVRAAHASLMCDLCVRAKKVFAHEHALYTYPQLCVHLPSMVKGKGKDRKSVEEVEGGVHPLCEFCRECFFSEDELFSHMRERHEECFLCKRSGVRDQYFMNWERLEHHFGTAHHPCNQATCLAQKFVVFGSALDLKAHMVDEHGAEMSNRDMRDARRVDVEFEEVARRRGGPSRGGEGGRAREHEREPPPRPGNGRREGFGARLTTIAPTPPTATPTPQRRQSPSPPPREDVDPAVLQKHQAFLARLQSFTANPSSVKAAIRGYRASESSARDVISTIWNVVDRSLEATASLVNAFVDLLDEEERKTDVLKAWRAFEVEQRQQFPDLVPQAVGGGYASIASGRVLNAQPRSTSSKVLDRVARAATGAASQSGSQSQPNPNQNRHVPGAFPPLSQTSGGRQPAHPHRTPWVGGGGGGGGGAPTLPPAPPQPRSVPGPGASLASKAASGNKQPTSNGSTLKSSEFPGLPSSSGGRWGDAGRPKIGGNASLRNILGGGGQAPPSIWGGGGGGGGEDPTSEIQDGVVGGGSNGGPATTGTGPGKKGKGKGKQKQTLFTLGSFPT